MSDKAELEKQYNELLKRWSKCEKFFENNDISLAEKIKWVPQAKQIVDNLGNLLEQMRKDGFVYTEDNILNGFENKIDEGN